MHGVHDPRARLSLVGKLIRAVFGSRSPKGPAGRAGYHPEKHYMRGTGPKSTSGTGGRGPSSSRS